eukprot:6258636-Amphidinium_carterae.1
MMNLGRTLNGPVLLSSAAIAFAFTAVRGGSESRILGTTLNCIRSPADLKRLVPPNVEIPIPRTVRFRIVFGGSARKEEQQRWEEVKADAIEHLRQRPEQAHCRPQLPELKRKALEDELRMQGLGYVVPGGIMA